MESPGAQAQTAPCGRGRFAQNTVGSTEGALTLLMYSRGVRLKVGRSSVRVSPMPAVLQL